MRSSSAKAKAAARFVLPPQLLGAAALAAFREEAQSLADDQVVGFNVDPAVMMANLRTGVASVHPRLGELVEARPRTKVPWILSIANLGHAIEYAVANCNTAPAVSRAELDAKYAELQRYREPALHFARGLASDLFAKLPAQEVSAIEAGKGYYDHGQDGVSLASLFRRHADEIAGMHPFTPAQLSTMEHLGAEVAASVTPGGARPKDRVAVGVSPALRDRLWTLLRQRHAELRKCGVELFGEDEVDEKVPRLNRRVQVVSAPQNDNGGGEEPAPAPDA
ncbi:MAG: hypothetical protein U0324_11540 [Polyangiales bacterium]